MGRPVKNVKVVLDDSNIGLIDFHQEQPTDRILYLSGEVKDQSIATLVAQLIALDNQNSSLPIKLIINTMGGAIDEMFALYDTIKFIRSPVHTIGLGKIMSAGLLILCCGDKGSRLISENSHVMFHPVSAGIQGNIFDMIIDFEDIKNRQELMNKCLMRETKMNATQYKALMGDGRDRFLTAQEAIKFGFVDKIMPVKM